MEDSGKPKVGPKPTTAPRGAGPSKRSVMPGAGYETVTVFDFARLQTIRLPLLFLMTFFLTLAR